MVYTTVKDIHESLTLLNELIKINGFTVVLGQRYGYKRLDLYKDIKRLKTIQSGMTSGECVRFINAMIEGINLGVPRSSVLGELKKISSN